MTLWQRLKGAEDRPALGAAEILKYIGPGLLVTVGFIDPGNWASNVAAGASYGYDLLWVVTLSTLMLIMLQHNVAHLGIASGLCLAEATTRHFRPWLARTILASALLASVATALAELLGAAIGLQMLFGMPLWLGTLLTLLLVVVLLLTNSYRRLERWIIAFVALIGLGFLYELSLVDVAWGEVALHWVAPAIPPGAMLIVMSVLGAVVMPHNLFLHSEIIQSRQWNIEQPAVIQRQLKYEFLDTLLSMVIGFFINSAMVIVAAATFFAQQQPVSDLAQAEQMLQPLLGRGSAIVFALGLLLAGISAAVCAGMAGGSIVAGAFDEPYDIKDRHTRVGVLMTLGGAALAALLVADPFRGLLVSQMLLSVQLPITVVTQIVLTSSRQVMGAYANGRLLKVTLWAVALAVGVLNVMLLWSVIGG